MIIGMELSVSPSDEDLGVLDEYVARRPGTSRSSALHAAITMLCERSLVAADWDATVGDGLHGAGRDAS